MTKLRRRAVSWTLAVAFALASSQLPNARAQLLNTGTDRIFEVGPDTSQNVGAGAVVVLVGDGLMQVHEAWRSLTDRAVRFDTATAYSRYFCGANNIRSTEPAWSPGYGKRDGWFTYDDSVGYTCVRPALARTSSAPSGPKWSKLDAEAVMAPVRSDVEEPVRSQLRFGRVSSLDATTLVHLALYHGGRAFQLANCPLLRLPVALRIDIKPQSADRSHDVEMSVSYRCVP